MVTENNGISLVDRQIYVLEVGRKTVTRTYGVYDSLDNSFIVIQGGELGTYTVDSVRLLDVVNLVLPESVLLEETFAECERHCRKLVYTHQPLLGGQGWVHTDDRQPCNEKVYETRNTLLINFLTFLDSMP